MRASRPQSGEETEQKLREDHSSRRAREEERTLKICRGSPSKVYHIRARDWIRGKNARVQTELGIASVPNSQAVKPNLWNSE